MSAGQILLALLKVEAMMTRQNENVANSSAALVMEHAFFEIEYVLLEY